MKIAACMLFGLLLAGCAAGPLNRDAPAVYDFGPQRDEATTAKTIRASLLLNGVAAPAWLDTPAIVYRLVYQDAARHNVYATSRWATAPAALLTQRLRTRLAAASEGGVLSAADGARADYALRIDLDEFSQVFDAADRSRGVVIARASLVNTARRTLVAQKNFAVERNATSMDAAGGVRALSAAGGELVDAVVVWTATAIAQDKK